MEVGTEGTEQQDSEIHRWIFVSPWPTLSVILLLCAEKPKGTTDSTGDGADSVISRRLIARDIWLL